MKQTSIPVKEDLRMRLNRLKYQFGFDNLDQVIRKVLEIATPQLNAQSASKESSTEEKGIAENEVIGGTSEKEVEE